MKKYLLLGFVSVLLCFSQAFGEKTSEGKALAELAFKSITDGDDSRDFIDLGEFYNFGDLIFTSMDANDDNKLSPEEFSSWDFGFSNIAEKRNRMAAYKTALRVIFAFWDRNGDGMISREENRKSAISDFQRADLNNDSVVTKDEFIHGFTVMIALRTALNS